MLGLIKRNVQVERRDSLTGLRFHAVVYLPVEVDYDLSWEQAFKLGSPKTEKCDPITRVGNMYPCDKNGKKSVTLSLCYTGPPAVYKGWLIPHAVKFAKKARLAVPGPRELLAIGQHYPGLREKLLDLRDPDIHRELNHALNLYLRELNLLSLKPHQSGEGEFMLEMNFSENELPSMRKIASDRRVNGYTSTWLVFVGEVPLNP